MHYASWFKHLKVAHLLGGHIHDELFIRQCDHAPILTVILGPAADVSDSTIEAALDDVAKLVDNAVQVTLNREKQLKIRNCDFNKDFK